MKSFNDIPEFDATQSNFPEEFRKVLRAKDNISHQERKYLKLIDEDPSRRRSRKLAKLENHARAALEINPGMGTLDWSTVDWYKKDDPDGPTILEKLLKMFQVIWPLIMMFLGEKDESESVAPSTSSSDPVTPVGTNKVTGTGPIATPGAGSLGTPTTGGTNK